MDNYEPEMDELRVPEEFDTECTLLSELVTESSLIGAARGALTEDLFFREENRAVFREVLRMFDAGEPVDVTTVYPRVDQQWYSRNILVKIGSPYLPTVLSHISILHLAAQKRRLFYACLEGLRKSRMPMVSEEELMDLPRKLTEEMTKGASGQTTQSIEDVIINIGEKIGSGVIERVPTGFHGLDRLLYGGFAPGNLVILAARPSVGKTAFMLQMARESARKGVPTLALSLEMTNEELAQRLLFSTNFVNAGEFMRGQVDMDSFEQAAQEFSGKPLYLDETPQTLEDVCSSAIVNHQRGRCNILFVDYLQLMSSNEKNDSLYRQVTEMTKRLKRLAKSLKIPVVVLCQLNRNSVSEKRAPQLHDLRDSGSIEQDADIVLMLERMTNMEGDLTGRVNMYVRKNRGGIAGDIVLELESDRSYTNFTELK